MHANLILAGTRKVAYQAFKANSVRKEFICLLLCYWSPEIFTDFSGIPLTIWAGT